MAQTQLASDVAALHGQEFMQLTTCRSGKVKRVRSSSRVVEGVARMLPPDETPGADALLGKKYGLMQRMFDLMQKVRSRPRIYLESVARFDGDGRDRSA